MIELTRFNEDPELVFDPSLVNLYADLKPQNSLWLSDENLKDDCQTSWCKAEDYWLGGPHRFKVIVDETKLICLDTLEKVEKFASQYGESKEFLNKDNTVVELDCFVNWPRVAELYSGVLFSPYRSIYNKWGMGAPTWYYSIDYASAAIWNEDAIIKIERS